MTWSPRRRYSAVAVFSQDLERVALIHKLRPAWQAGKANFPGGKVEAKDITAAMEDRVPMPLSAKWPQETFIAIHRRCAARELKEETGLVVDASSLTLFCTLRFRSCEGDDAECQFFCCRGNDEAVPKTMESEKVFVGETEHILRGEVGYDVDTKTCFYTSTLPTMSNLPWLTAMARQTLRGDGTDSTPPFVVYEAGAKEHA